MRRSRSGRTSSAGSGIARTLRMREESRVAHDRSLTAAETQPPAVLLVLCGRPAAAQNGRTTAMMTRTKLALGTAATVIALAACGPSGGTPGNHAGPRIHGVQQAQSQSYVNLDAKDLANL